MARYTGPVEKLERRLGVSLALKGERRLAGKSALEKKTLCARTTRTKKSKNKRIWLTTSREAKS